MKEITVFQNEQFGSVRTVVRNGEPWFVAADVCRALEIGNTSQALTRLQEDEKDIISNDIIRLFRLNGWSYMNKGTYSNF